jgi:hypothetical protein
MSRIIFLSFLMELNNLKITLMNTICLMNKFNKLISKLIWSWNLILHKLVGIFCGTFFCITNLL